MKKIHDAIEEVTKKQPLFTALVAELAPKEDDSIPTAATDGERIVYNPDFIKDLTDEETAAVLLHETLHCSFRHLWRREKRNHIKWNISCDYAVNLIVSESFKLPKGALLESKYYGMSAEDIYDKLPDPKKTKMKVQEWGEHDKWEDGKKKKSKSGGSMVDKIKKKLKSAGQSEKEKEREEKRKKARSEAKRKRLEEKWKRLFDKAIVKNYGKMPDSIKRIIEKHYYIPVIDWTNLISHLLSTDENDYSFSNPDRRFSGGDFILPGLYSEDRLKDVIFAYDTCLRGDMQINLWNGKTKKISDISIGDLVVGYKNGIPVPSKVKNKFNYKNKDLIKIKTQSKIIFCTPQHRFLTNNGWKRAYCLDKSDIVLIYLGKQYETSKEQLSTLESRRKKISNGKLAQKNSERNVDLSQTNTSICMASNEENRIKKNSCPKVSTYGITQKKSLRNRMVLFSRNNRWRGNINNWIKKIKQKWIYITQFNSLYSNFYIRQVIIRLVIPKVSLWKISNSPKFKIYEKLWLFSKTNFPNSLDRTQNFTSFGKSNSILNNKKRTMQFINSISYRQEKPVLEKKILKKTNRMFLENPQSEFKTERIVEIKKSGKDEVFDLATSTENYLVQGIVCHNSGSINNRDLLAYYMESIALFNNFSSLEGWIGICDCSLQNFKKIDQFHTFNEFDFTGGGGTSFRPVFREIEKRGLRPKAVFYFTDTYGDFPEEPNYPVFWMVKSSVGDMEKRDVPFGQVVKFLPK